MSKPIRTAAQRAKLAQRKQPYYVQPFADTAVSLGVRRSGRDRYAWVARVRVAPNQYKQTVFAQCDPYPDGLSYDDALAELPSHVDALRRTETPADELTVREAADLYLIAKDRPGKSRRALETITAHANRFAATFGARAIVSLTVAELEQWRDELANTPPKRRSAISAKAERFADVDMSDPEVRRRREMSTNRIMTTAKALLNFAHDRREAGNPDIWRKGLSAFEQVHDERDERFLSSDEIQRVTNALSGGLRDLFVVCVNTGARVGEVISLDCGHFEPERNELAILRTKTGKRRRIRVSQEIGAHLCTLAAGRGAHDPLIRNDKGERFGRNTYSRPWKVALERAGVEYLSFYRATRHTFASHAVQSGANLLAVAKQLGHGSLDMLRKNYGHLSDQAAQDLVDKLAPAPSFKHGGSVEPIAMPRAASDITNIARRSPRRAAR